MKRIMLKTAIIPPLMLTGLAVAYVGTQTKAQVRLPEMTATQYQAYLRAIENTSNMVGDPEAVRLAKSHGLDVLNVTWEDTGRYKGSSVGPNISDMTIQVAVRKPRTDQIVARAMPVIRFPNFSDVTCDLDPRDFTVLVGNQKDQPLRRTSLYDVLQTPSRFMTDPGSWATRGPRTLLAERDSKVLVSAQACFLPVPKEGLATFNPVLFNYQSYPGNPAVLTILATREGTSMTVIDNKRDTLETGFAWGQRLFHNQGGMRASLTGQRLSDFKAQGSPSPGGVRPSESSLNMVLLIQVPLKHKEMRYKGFGGGGGMMDGAPTAGAEMAKNRSSDTEAAVIGHGDYEGPFTEFDHLPVERDPRFPVRVTVQFYKATSTGVMSEADAAQIKREIDRIYKSSDSVGSLVTGGRTGRVTEYDGPKVQPRDWWNSFWRQYEEEMGESRHDAIRKVQQVLGRDYMSRPVCGLYVRDLLREVPKSKSGRFGF